MSDMTPDCGLILSLFFVNFDGRFSRRLVMTCAMTSMTSSMSRAIYLSRSAFPIVPRFSLHRLAPPCACRAPSRLHARYPTEWPAMRMFFRCMPVPAVRPIGQKLLRRWAALFSLPHFSRTTTSVTRLRPRFPPRHGHLSWRRRALRSAATPLPPLKEVRGKSSLLWLPSGLSARRVVWVFKPSFRVGGHGDGSIGSSSSECCRGVIGRFVYSSPVGCASCAFSNIKRHCQQCCSAVSADSPRTCFTVSFFCLSPCSTLGQLVDAPSPLSYRGALPCIIRRTLGQASPVFTCSRRSAHYCYVRSSRFPACVFSTLHEV